MRATVTCGKLFLEEENAWKNRFFFFQKNNNTEKTTVVLLSVRFFQSRRLEKMSFVLCLLRCIALFSVGFQSQIIQLCENRYMTRQK